MVKCNYEDLFIQFGTQEHYELSKAKFGKDIGGPILIGKGHFAQVFLGENTVTGQRIVIKAIKTEQRDEVL